MGTRKTAERDGTYWSHSKYSSTRAPDNAECAGRPIKDSGKGWDILVTF